MHVPSVYQDVTPSILSPVVSSGPNLHMHSGRTRNQGRLSTHKQRPKLLSLAMPKPAAQQACSEHNAGRTIS